jgi:UDP-N-acetylmuramoylalanine--D-glutamate ligase
VKALVYGFAITGQSTARALLRRGYEVVAADDSIDDGRIESAIEIGVPLVPSPRDPAEFVAQFDIVSPAPGVPEQHPIIRAASGAGIPVVSEIELAYRWEQDRVGGPRPILAITGTDGKTTTTELTVAILREAGKRAMAVGNTDIPMVDVLESDLDVLVVECTSFRLAWTERFRADAAVWLNLAPDHLNWHSDMSAYVAAKARVFDLQRADDIAIGFASDPIVRKHLDQAPARRRTFALADADYHIANSVLMSPSGPICNVDSMARRLPHDITNALAASALVLETGLASHSDVAEALRSFEAPPHRLEPLGTSNGVTWFNDSKATTPHAASVAIAAFDSLVLIAGGSRKGLDLSPMAAEPGRLRAVVAIGEAAADIHEVFDGRTTVVDAASMSEAVAAAAGLAQTGDAVVLSPGCASFDWYSGYPARGDDFRRLVLERMETA